jgi:Icc protein
LFQHVQISFTDLSEWMPMLKIAQLSDPHLGPNPEFELGGVCTLESFRTVLAEVRKQQPDLIVVSGDISAEPDLFAYQQFFDSFDFSQPPMVWLPGNHDSLELIARAPKQMPYRKRFVFNGWQLLLLNSSIEDQPQGVLPQRDLEMTRQSLEECHLPTAIFLHHPVMPVGSRWLDKQRVANAEELEAIVQQFDHVKGVFCGHVHQAYSEWRDGRLYASAPSTCVQFLPNSDDFALSNQNPGYLMHRFSRTGKIHSQVHRVHLANFSIDTRCVGY